MIYTLFNYILKVGIVTLVVMFIVAMITPVCMILIIFTILIFITNLLIKIYEDIRAKSDPVYKEQLKITRKIKSLRNYIIKTHNKFTYISANFHRLLPLDDRYYAWFDEIDNFTYSTICIIDDEMKGLEFSNQPKTKIIQNVEDLYN